jgi:hypothetical protein
MGEHLVVFPRGTCAPPGGVAVDQFSGAAVTLVGSADLVLLPP